MLAAGAEGHGFEFRFNLQQISPRKSSTSIQDIYIRYSLKSDRYLGHSNSLPCQLRGEFDNARTQIHPPKLTRLRAWTFHFTRTGHSNYLPE